MNDKILPFTGEATIAILETLILLADMSILTLSEMDEPTGEWYDYVEDLNNWKGVLASQLRGVKARHGVPLGSRRQNRNQGETPSGREPPNRVGPLRADGDGSRKPRPSRYRGERPPSEPDFRGLEHVEPSDEET